MNVTFFNREKRNGNFSIEELFSLLKNEFGKHLNYKDYHFDPAKSRLKNILEVKMHQQEVNHITGDVNFLALGISGNKTILTVHDLCYYENPVHPWYRKLLYRLLWLKLPFDRVKYITTVSEFTRKKIIHYFPSISNKIRVIYNPYNPIFKYAPKIFNEQKPGILMIGTGNHKNFNRLFEAVIGISCHLTIIGKLTERQIEFLNQNKIEYTNLFNLSLEEVYTKYIECDLVYFASLYEGFGLPIIEANVVGRPVITSNIASMPEIASDAAILVDPYSVQEIKNALIKIIQDKELRERLIKQGQKNCMRFQLTEIKNQYINLYKEVAGEIKND